MVSCSASQIVSHSCWAYRRLLAEIFRWLLAWHIRIFLARLLGRFFAWLPGIYLASAGIFLIVSC